jgi:hypothetical protein
MTCSLVLIGRSAGLEIMIIDTHVAEIHQYQVFHYSDTGGDSEPSGDRLESQKFRTFSGATQQRDYFTLVKPNIWSDLGACMTGVPDILWLEEIRKEDIPSVGGKGASLGEMASIGLPIPPAFVVTSQAFRRFLELSGVDKRLFELLQDLNVDNNDELEESARKAKAMVMEAPMPEDLKAGIAHAYKKLSRGGEIVAARSSATAEDLPDASFAGQQETILNIKGE